MKSIEKQKRDLFIRFLQTKDALVPYILNISLESCRTSKRNITLSQALKNPNRVWLLLFYWDKTTEGHKYWLDIYCQWTIVKRKANLLARRNIF